ncbi:MAG: MiaB/RimO family radical SAM methylthiotransferase [Patescibacteria group bacterium]|nr:MiaB/RimO family radical SAM methylthiotransferase [Patescibacteria group bacterium]
MTYCIKTFGCQMNQSDAERVATILEKYKFKPAASIDAADLIVFVTCGVRQSAENRVYGQINNIRKKFPAKYIILTGCLAHRKDVRRRLKGKVNLFTTIKDFPKEIVSCIKYHVSSIKKKIKIHNTLYLIHNTENKPCNNYLGITPTYTSSYTAHIPIMSGCNNFCSYCVVPYARGREYSRPVEDILKEIKGLVKKGCKEIVLLGQNVNSYNSRIRTNEKRIGANIRSHSLSLVHNSRVINFADLLKLIDSIPGNFWITFLTSHPKDMSDELIETIVKSKKICEYISLPAQSGDNEILKKMNRHYTISHYKNIVKKIRTAFLRLNLKNFEGLALKIYPSISTDIIVGFSGETKKQFENTAKLMREIKFDMTYVSQYSPRPETAAWRLKDNVSRSEKVRREKVLTKILEKTALENNKKYIRKIVEVLVDKRFDLEELQATASKGKVEPWTGKYLGHTRTQKKVIFRSNKKIPVRSFAKVKITKAKAFGLEGEINWGHQTMGSPLKRV